MLDRIEFYATIAYLTPVSRHEPTHYSYIKATRPNTQPGREASDYAEIFRIDHVSSISRCDEETKIMMTIILRPMDHTLQSPVILLN